MLTLLLSPCDASKQYISASFHDLPKAGKWLCLRILYLHLHCIPASEFLLSAFCFPKPFLAADFQRVPEVFRRCSAMPVCAVCHCFCCSCAFNMPPMFLFHVI